MLKWNGSHMIIKKFNNRTYLLLKKDDTTSNTIHEDKLKIYKELELLEPHIVIE